MLKALLLIFDPAGTWEKIEKTQRHALLIFVFSLLPLLLISSFIEGYGLMTLGREQQVSHYLKPVAQTLVMRYEVFQLGMSLLILLGGAWFLKRVGQGFHRRHSYGQCFTTVAYSLSPLFLLRAVNALPAVDSWICWAVGIALSVAAFYRGIPRVMKPDPSNALGLYLTACILFACVTALANYLCIMVLDEKVLTAGWPWLEALSRG